MHLPFRDFLIQKTNELGIKLYENEIYRYAAELNEVDSKKTDDDIAACYCMIRYADPKLYCGEGQHPRARYYLMDEYNNLYWFVSARDAVLFAMPSTCAIVGTILDVEAVFHKYHRYFNEGFYFLYPEDLDNIDEITSRQHGYVCLDKNIRFDTEEDIVIWLVNSGLASNAATARRQLTKHLMGNTTACYKLRFKKV